MVHSPVKVAIYVDRKDMAVLAEKCIAAVREHMPQAEVWHLTTPEGPELSADHRLCMDVKGPFAYRQAVISAGMTGDVLFLDADVIVRADVSGVFAEGFDLCVTTDMKPGAEGIKYNGGVIFCRVPAYWEAIARECKDLDFCVSPGDWEPIERARNRVADSGKFRLKVLPGEEYNYIPKTPEDMGGKVAHYRGKRKAWLFPITGFESGLNTPMETMIEQAVENLRRDLPLFIEHPECSAEAIIIGGGPSLYDNLTNIRFHKGRGGVIFALNGAHDWLIERGIVPDFHVLLDARKENARFVVRPHKSVTYLIASQCHPDVFDALEGHHVIVWTACTDTPENDQRIAAEFPGKPVMMIGGGATVGLKTLNLAYLWGFRRFALYGFDSSYRCEANHAYRQDLNDGESRIEVHAAGRDFICAPWMAKQTQEFQGQYRQLTALGCRVSVYGDGLLPHVAAQLKKEVIHV